LGQNGEARLILTPNELFLTFRAPNECAKFHQNCDCSSADRQTDRQIDGCNTSDFILVGAFARSPAYSWARAYAAENQRVGKTRRRSIYSADRRQQPANRTAAKVTVPSCKLGICLMLSYSIVTNNKIAYSVCLSAVVPTVEILTRF